MSQHLRPPPPPFDFKLRCVLDLSLIPDKIMTYNGESSISPVYLPPSPPSTDFCTVFTIIYY